MKSRIRLTALAIVVAMTLSLAVFADESVYSVALSCQSSVKSGENLVCTVTVANDRDGSGILGGDIYISYDNSLLTFIGVEKADMPSESWTAELYGDESGILHLGFYDDDFETVIGVGGSASCRVTFRAAGGGASTLAVKECSFINGAHENDIVGALGSTRFSIDSGGGTSETVYAGSVAVTGLSEPFSGDAPASSAEIDIGFEITDISWTPSDASFKADTVYTVKIDVRITDSREFGGKTTASINGSICEFERVSPTEARLSLTYPKTPAEAEAVTEAQTEAQTEEAEETTIEAEETEAATEAQTEEAITEAQTREAATESNEPDETQPSEAQTEDTPKPSDPDEQNTPSERIDEPDGLFYGDFIDVRSDAWYVQYVDFVFTRGLFKGISETEFAPDTPTTRAMFVTVLGRIAGIDVQKYTNQAFSDVQTDAWYAPYVDWAAENEIVKGMSADTFMPDAEITREQLAVMTTRYLSFTGVDVYTSESVPFTDSRDINSWSVFSIAFCAESGLIQGYPDNTFLPRRNATRAEVAAIVTRLCEKF